MHNILIYNLVKMHILFGVEEKMKNYIFTDLAYEIHENAKNGDLRTKEYRGGTCGEIQIFEMQVENDAQVKRYARPRGCYLTVICKKIWQLNENDFSSLREVLVSTLRRMLLGLLPKGKDNYTILVVGLGNADFSADAIGPRTVERINVTRHLENKDGDQGLLFSMAAMEPGVVGKTGMEAAEQIRGVVSVIGADAVIAVDALAASRVDRLGATVQLADSGICPGSGVGNARRAITEQTVGVPVLALGVPTVVSAATLVADTLRRGGIQTLSAEMKATLDDGRGYFVCPKESDLIATSTAFLLADALDHLGCIKRDRTAYSEA